MFQNTVSLVSYHSSTPERAMGFLRLPGRLYDSIYLNYGWFGVAFAILGVVLFVVAIMIWWDRRR